MSDTERVILEKKIASLAKELSHSILEYTRQITSTGIQPGKPPRPKRALEIVGRLTYGMFEITQGIKALKYRNE